MAYRIRNFDNFSVDHVNEIFRRGRGLVRADAPAETGGEDFPMATTINDKHLPTPPVEVVDDELESVR